MSKESIEKMKFITQEEMEKEFKCIQCGFEGDAIDFMRAVDVDLPDILCNDCTENIAGKQKKEFNLSEKIETVTYSIPHTTDRFILIKNIKEFIKLIKMESLQFNAKENNFEGEVVCVKDIDKLAGDKLC